MPLTLLQSFLEALTVPGLAIDRSERIVACNTEANTMIGQDLLQRNYVAMLRQPTLVEAIEESLLDGQGRKTRYLSNDGVQDTTFDVYIRIVPDVGLDDAGAAVVTFFDVSHKEEGAQMRRDFVANVSHELRTPLTSLMGFIETLKGPARADREAAERFLDIMQGEAERMNRLIGDLMSLNRVEKDERVRPTERVDLMAVVSSVIRSMSPLAKDAGVTLDLQSDTQSLALPADGDQLTQVFTNLVENAIKYGGAGEKVTIRVIPSEREAVLRSPGVRVQVTDYGPGIDPMHLPRITERFYRADDHRSRALGGTGLGLAIVKHIINRHRGRLRVESDLGKGATFTVILPTEGIASAPQI